MTKIDLLFGLCVGLTCENNCVFQKDIDVKNIINFLISCLIFLTLNTQGYERGGDLQFVCWLLFSSTDNIFCGRDWPTNRWRDQLKHFQPSSSTFIACSWNSFVRCFTDQQQSCRHSGSLCGRSYVSCVMNFPGSGVRGETNKASHAPHRIDAIQWAISLLDFIFQIKLFDSRRNNGSHCFQLCILRGPWPRRPCSGKPLLP